MTVTFPASPTNGQQYIIKCFSLSTILNNNILNFNGNCQRLDGLPVTQLDLGTVTGLAYTFIYSSDDVSWLQV